MFSMKFTQTGRFLCNNYDQASMLIDKLTDELEHSRQALGIQDNRVFSEWLAEEAAFLSIKPSEASVREQDEMDYVKTLKDLQEAQ